jgi:hypothetical protein
MLVQVMYLLYGRGAVYKLSLAKEFSAHFFFTLWPPGGIGLQPNPSKPS